MENKNILVAGCSTKKGIKIAKFLKDRGFIVYGLDRFLDSHLKVFRFFKIDMRHVESMGLMLSIANPKFIIFCPDEILQIDYSYPSYLGLLNAMTNNGIKNIILCLNNVDYNPKTLTDVSHLAMYHLTNIFINDHKLNTRILLKGDNLLKEIKRFVTSREEKDGE